MYVNNINFKQIIIYHTNDLHGRFATYDEDDRTIGIEKISKVVNLSLLNNKNTFWFDAGDFIHGTPRMTNSPTDKLIDMINSLPLNAICTGNHDYNLSIDYLHKLSKSLDTYILSANTINKETNTPILLPYIIYNVDINNDDYISEDSNDHYKDNIKIGVFGLSTPETAYKTNPNNVKDIIFDDPYKVANNIVSILKDNCDFIIALTHLGLDVSSEYTSEKLAKNVDGIDLIIDGHSHSILENGLKVNNTTIVQAGSHGYYLGKVTLLLNKDKIYIRPELLNEDDVNSIIKNPDNFIQDKLRNIDELTNQALNHIITYNPRELSGNRELVRCTECELGNLIADAIKWKTKTDIAIVNGGTLRTGLPQGNITFKNLISIFPFENVVQSANIKGKIIKELLEHAISSAPNSFGGFMDISGMVFSFNRNNEVGKKIINININGIELDDEKEYTISTLDFIFAGGDGYSMLTSLKVDHIFGNIEYIVAEYLNIVKDINIKVGRIRMI